MLAGQQELWQMEETDLEETGLRFRGPLWAESRRSNSGWVPKGHTGINFQSRKTGKTLQN
ncbi:MAG TPA: hypothetical protein DIC36_05820 [Gammaproteobacteria bacterium]|nr:hypothetical protein [Gammaproteobacteria bacterium]